MKETPPQRLETQGESGELPGRLTVRIPGFHCRGQSSVLGGGTENPQASRCDQKKTEEYVLWRTKRFRNEREHVGFW